jgi:hypothetical protein
MVEPGEDPPTNVQFYIFIAFCVFDFVIVCTICCLMRKINIAIKIMEVAADFITEVCCILLVPPVITFILVIWVAIWTLVAVCVYS